MPNLSNLKQRDPRVMMIWRRFMAEALSKQLTQCDGDLPMTEVSRRARISASLRLRSWENANPCRATVAA